MKYNYLLGTHNSEVKKKIQTKQFELSEILLDKRFELSLDFKEIAKIAGFSPEEYIDLEYGEPNIPIKDYQQALRNIEAYKINYLLNKNISKEAKQIPSTKPLYKRFYSDQASDFEIKNNVELVLMAL